AIREKALGARHAAVGESVNNLAIVYQAQGKYTEAEGLFKRALAIRETALGASHRDVGQTLNNLAIVYQAQGKYTEAEGLFKRALAIREKALGASHPDVAQTLNNLGNVYRVQGKYSEAEDFLKRAHALWKHLPAMIRDGKQNAFVREFGHMAFDHAKADRDYAERFDQAMTSYSAAEAVQVLEALQGADLSGVRVFCDVAGGHGYMTCALLGAYPRLSGIVLDLPDVVADREALWARKLGLEARCRYVGGDMFKEGPKADTYGFEVFLH